MGSSPSNPAAPASTGTTTSGTGQQYTPPPDTNTQQLISNMQAMKQSGAFDTDYQRAMKQHPILMSLAQGAMAYGQGLSKQPYYTDFMNNQAAGQRQGMEGMTALMKPASQPFFMGGIPGMGGSPIGGVTPNPFSMPKAMETPKGSFKIPDMDEAKKAKEAGATHWDDSSGQWLTPVKVK